MHDCQSPKVDTYERIVLYGGTQSSGAPGEAGHPLLGSCNTQEAALLEQDIISVLACALSIIPFGRNA